jgi:glycyl-tRNA synthetase (class II)
VTALSSRDWKSTVTIRERDSMDQQRVSIDRLQEALQTSLARL